MAKYIIDSNTLTGLANAFRTATGEDRTYTPAEMIEAVSTILDSATYILVDEDGDEIPAVFVENETVFDATANDIRIGKIAATAEGVTEGTKEIPAYHTEQGWRLVEPGESLDIFMYSDRCHYTKLQVIVCSFATSADDSVAAQMVVINDKLYPTGSAEAISEVSVDSDNQSIKLGLVNDGAIPLLIRYMTIKEEP